jgi:CSLREA domain-containing protein
MIRLSLRSLLVLVWVLSIGAIHAARPQPTGGVGAMPPTYPATTISVTTHVDDFTLNNTCSLREAVYAAVHDQATDACVAGSATDVIALPAATYVLTRTGMGEDGGLTGDLDITGTLHISGVTSATTIIDGNGTDRILDIFSGAVTLDHLTLRNGSALTSGGAIRLRSGFLAANQTTFNRNSVLKALGEGLTFGGAITNETGTVTLRSSLFTYNLAQSIYFESIGFGGAVFTGQQAQTAIIDSVFEDTIYQYKGDTIANWGRLSISGSLFTRNNAPVRNRGLLLIESTRFLTNTDSAIENDGRMSIYASEIAFNRTPDNQFYCQAGGGIVNNGEAFIDKTSIHHNVMEYGGGIASFGVTYIRDSAIVGNRSTNTPYRGRDICFGLGGGIYSQNDRLSIENSTIAHNLADYGGGGINSSSLAVTITNTTIVSNYASLYHAAGNPNPSPANSGGINAGSPITITNTLITNNRSRLAPNGSDCQGTLVSANSLIQVPLASCVITGTQAGMLVGVEPLLGPLADHGGATLTYDLLPGSPAIDAGSASGCPDHDQRGVFRPQDGDALGGARCDIGAYEYVNPATAVTATPTTIPSATMIPSATTTPNSTATATTTSTASATPLASATATATTTSTATTISTATPSGTATATATVGATPTATGTVIATPTTRLHAVYLPYLRR